MEFNFVTDSGLGKFRLYLFSFIISLHCEYQRLLPRVICQAEKRRCIEEVVFAQSEDVCKADMSVVVVLESSLHPLYILVGLLSNFRRSFLESQIRAHRQRHVIDRRLVSPFWYDGGECRWRSWELQAGRRHFEGPPSQNAASSC